MKPNATLISANGLSEAWVEALKAVLDRGDIAPLVVTFPATQLDGNWDRIEVRTKLDETLVQKAKFACATVANTIFPSSLWDPDKPAERLYSAYFQILPVLWKYRQNKRGLYFERMIDYGNNKDPGSGFNQLARVIENWHGGLHRRSGLQASIFDATKDHLKTPYLGFPCLHQVAFTPLGEKSLGITGYYGHEYIVDKPLVTPTGERVINVTRVQTFGSSRVHWLRITVSPKDPALFTIRERLVPENIDRE